MSAPQSLTTAMPNGVTNAAAWQTMAQAGVPDPTWAHVYSNDFDTFAAGDWTTTTVGSGTTALGTTDGGSLVLVTSAGASDSVMLQLKGATFQAVPGKDVFFKLAGTVFVDATLETIHAGLIATSTTPLTAADGVYIVKASGATTFALNAVIGGVTVSAPFGVSVPLVIGTYFEVGFHIDYLGNIEAFMNPTTGAAWSQLSATSSAAGASLSRGAVARIPASSLPNGITQVMLNPSFGITNGAAAIHTFGVDYVVAVRNR